MDRAVSPVIGTLLLTGVTVVIAAALLTTLGPASLGGAALGDTTDLTSFVRLSAHATADGRIVLTHEGGDPIEVTDATVTVVIDGTPLPRQPPVPFFSTVGFEPGPTGPFNSAADPTWSVGERASFIIAGSNGPDLDAGSVVVVTVSQNGRRVARTRSAVSRRSLRPRGVQGVRYFVGSTSE
ncbi:MAG: type IV pilin [Halodesulfurarchaeum sp.]